MASDAARFADRAALMRHTVHARAAVFAAIRAFFARRGFLEVDPPQLATSPGLELHLEAVEATLRAGMGGKPVQRYLVTSPEYHCKRLLSVGFPRIYSLQHAFRSGERGPWHNPEFAMLEWYRAGAPWAAIVRDVRQLVRFCARALQRQSLIDHPHLRPLAETDAPWPRLALLDAVRQFAGFDPGRAEDAEMLRSRARQAGLDVRAGDDAADVLVQALVERVEPALKSLPAVVLAPWPACMASLAQRVPDKPWLAERFEVYLHGVELANGFGELTDATEQRARFVHDLEQRKLLGKPLYPLDDRFLAALDHGMPAASGVALGVDRMLMLLLGLDDIADVLPFPFESA
jgi:lysyl-tRNA synthetase class 2